jgi:hypothetical protein
MVRCRPSRRVIWGPGPSCAGCPNPDGQACSATWNRQLSPGLFAPTSLACCSTAHPAVRRELALRAQTALLTGAGFHQEQQRRGTKSRQSPGDNCRFHPDLVSCCLFQGPTLQYVERAAVGTAGFARFFNLEEYPRVTVPAAHLRLWAIER